MHYALRFSLSRARTPALAAAVFCAGVLFSVDCVHSPSRKAIDCPPSALKVWPIPSEWLVKQVDFEEAEYGNMINGVPFGRANEQWVKLLALREPQDDLWRYDSSQPWGMAGYVLVRECQIVFNVVTTQYE
jgi:hypothetical protein